MHNFSDEKNSSDYYPLVFGSKSVKSLKGRIFGFR